MGLEGAWAGTWLSAPDICGTLARLEVWIRVVGRHGRPTNRTFPGHYLNIFPERRIREALRLMGRSPDERVSREVAREICLRESAKAAAEFESIIARPGVEAVAPIQSLARLELARGAGGKPEAQPRGVPGMPDPVEKRRPAYPHAQADQVRIPPPVVAERWEFSNSAVRSTGGKPQSLWGARLCATCSQSAGAPSRVQLPNGPHPFSPAKSQAG